MEMKKVEMDKKEILKHIKERALQEHVPILQDESLELILMVLRLHQPKKYWRLERLLAILRFNLPVV